MTTPTRACQPEETYATYRNLMQAAMVSLRPTQELYIRHRKELTDPWVGPGALRHRDMITKHANDLLDEWIDDGDVEFISRFARPLPQRVMASLLGFPLEDIPQLAEWGDAVVTAFVHGSGLKHELTPEQTRDMLARLDGFQDYIYEHVRAKRLDPQDDMVSFLCEVHYEALDRKLTDLEIAGIVHAMIIGGLETTQYALEEQAQLLCEHPGMFEQLRHDRAKVRAFTEEGMRMRSPTHGLSTRATSQDEVFQGVEVPAGSLLHLRFGAANVDEEEFACPFDLDLDREGLTRHVAFSTGPRVCPGANLSRVEQQIAWGVLLDRLESIEYGDGNDWLHQPGIMLGTLKLNLRFTKARCAAVARDGPHDQRFLTRSTVDRPGPWALRCRCEPHRRRSARHRRTPGALRRRARPSPARPPARRVHHRRRVGNGRWQRPPRRSRRDHGVHGTPRRAPRRPPDDEHLHRGGLGRPARRWPPRPPALARRVSRRRVGSAEPDAACSTADTTMMSCAPTPAGASGIGDTSTARSRHGPTWCAGPNQSKPSEDARRLRGRFDELVGETGDLQQPTHLIRGVSHDDAAGARTLVCRDEHVQTR